MRKSGLRGGLKAGAFPGARIDSGRQEWMGFLPRFPLRAKGVEQHVYAPEPKGASPCQGECEQPPSVDVYFGLMWQTSPKNDLLPTKTGLAGGRISL